MSCHQRHLLGSYARLFRTAVIRPMDCHVLRVCAVGICVRFDLYSPARDGHPIDDGNGLGILACAHLPHHVASRPEGGPGLNFVLRLRLLCTYKATTCSLQP